MDFLKIYPFVSIEDYYWKYSYAMIRIMAKDATKVIPLSEKQAEKYKQYKRNQKKNVATPQVTDDPDVFCAALGIPSF